MNQPEVNNFTAILFLCKSGILNASISTSAERGLWVQGLRTCDSSTDSSMPIVGDWTGSVDVLSYYSAAKLFASMPKHFVASRYEKLTWGRYIRSTNKDVSSATLEMKPGSKPPIADRR